MVFGIGADAKHFDTLSEMLAFTATAVLETALAVFAQILHLGYYGKSLVCIYGRFLQIRVDRYRFAAVSFIVRVVAVQQLDPMTVDLYRFVKLAFFYVIHTPR